MDKNKKIEDLIKDDSFINWVNQSNEEDIAKWDNWNKKHPDQKELLEDAKVLVQGIPFKKNEKDDQQVNASWSSFASKLQQQEPLSPPRQTPIRSFSSNLLKIAAVFLLAAASFWGIQKWTAKPASELIVFQNTSNEVRSIKLPDGSKVTLNTNSKVEYFDNFENQDLRQVNLEGEGYFEVEKQPTGKTFQVQSKDLTVEVVGTEFNINAKRKNPIVSLTEGKVNLKLENFNTQKLDAGQTAQFNPRKNEFEISNDQIDYWKSWTMQKWSFGNGMEMEEVLRRIKETFDVNIKIEDRAVFDRKASGDVSVESKEVLFEALSVLLDLKFEERNGKVEVSTLEEVGE